MNINLVVTDLDNTLLNDSSKVTEATKEVMTALKEKGVIIAAATGRPLWRAEYVYNENPYIEYVISSNGAVIKSIKNSEVIKADYMNVEDFNKIIVLLENYNINYEVSGVIEGSYEVSFVNNLKAFENLKHVQKKWFQRLKEIKNIRQYINNSHICVCKINAVIPLKEERKEIIDIVKRIPEVYVTSGASMVLEIMTKGADKGNALTYLSNYLQIPKETIIAFGDNENDISLLKSAGIGVAMGNAKRELQIIADFITEDNNSDGVAAFLRRFL